MRDDFFMSDILYLIGFIIGRGLCIVGGFLAGYIGINFLMALATWARGVF